MGVAGVPGPVLDAMARLDALAEDGRSPRDVAAAAEQIVAGWWCDTRGNLAPGRLVLLVQELRYWCAVSAATHAAHWNQMHRAGCPGPAEQARLRAVALDQAQRALHPMAERDRSSSGDRP